MGKYILCVVLLCCTLEAQQIGILVRGEAFRRGGQGSRETGHPSSIEPQRQAAEALYACVVDVWRRAGHTVQVFLDTYPCQGGDQGCDQGCERILPEMYPGASLTVRPFHHDMRRALNEGLRQVWRAHPEVEGWFITRFDLLFKPAFTPVARRIVQDTRTLLPWQISARFGGVLASGYPRVADTFFWVPRAHIPPFLEMLTQPSHDGLHGAWEELAPRITESHIGFMVEGEGYDSDSAKERNPYYRFVGRPEAL